MENEKIIDNKASITTFFVGLFELGRFHTAN
jgi:hypothetical protein